MDFFTVPTPTFRVLYVRVTEHPTGGWIIQQLREAFPFDSAPRCLIFDNDKKYGVDVLSVIVLNERHLHGLLSELVAYDHDDRTHLALGKSTPSMRTAVSERRGRADWRPARDPRKLSSREPDWILARHNDPSRIAAYGYAALSGSGSILTITVEGLNNDGRQLPPTIGGLANEGGIRLRVQPRTGTAMIRNMCRAIGCGVAIGRRGAPKMQWLFGLVAPIRSHSAPGVGSAKERLDRSDHRIFGWGAELIATRSAPPRMASGKYSGFSGEVRPFSSLVLVPL